MKPEVLTSKDIYEGKVFDIRLDKIREGDAEYEREIVVHNGSAVIVPVFDDETIGMVRQYRHAAEKYLLEVPAGSIEEGESPETCAARELEEEVGARAEKVELISEFYVSPGFLTERMYVYLATGLTLTAQRLESDELIEIERIPFGKALDQIRTGGIEDAKSIVGIVIAGSRRGYSI